MIYFYHCYRGAHLSCVAAALHLGIIKPSAKVEEILGLEYFDVLQNRDMGCRCWRGTATATRLLCRRWFRQQDLSPLCHS